MDVLAQEGVEELVFRIGRRYNLAKYVDPMRTLSKNMEQILLGGVTYVSRHYLIAKVSSDRNYQIYAGLRYLTPGYQGIHHDVDQLMLDFYSNLSIAVGKAMEDPDQSLKFERHCNKLWNKLIGQVDSW